MLCITSLTGAYERVNNPPPPVRTIQDIENEYHQELKG
jgi:hypothetical protein